MGLDPRKVINSRYGVELALWLCRIMPNTLGKYVARVGADWIAAHKNWEMVRAVRANRWVASGGKLTCTELDQAVRANFRFTANSIFNLYHNFHSLTAMQRLVDIDSIAHEVLFPPKYNGRGFIVAGLHLGNFDLAFQTAGLMGLNAFVLTLPELPGGYQLQYDIRRKTGANLVPASMKALRQAIDYLCEGGMVLTGMERPDINSNYRPRFFGRPAPLPVHHIVLALRAQVPIRVGCSLLGEDGRYHLNFSEPIEMQRRPDHRQTVLFNAEEVLQVAEGYIKRAPDQWEMTFPVWPEALDEVKC